MLSTFKKSDLESFEHFLKSPLCKAKKNAILLFEALKQRGHVKLNREPQTEKKKIFGDLFPDEAFDDHKLNKVLSALNEHIRLFQACCQLRQDKALQREALTYFHFEQGDMDAYQKNIKEVLKEFEKAPECSHLCLERFQFQKRQLDVETDVTRLEFGKVAVENLLERHYLLIKIQFACYELSKGMRPKQSNKNEIPKTEEDRFVYQSLLERAALFDKESLLLQRYRFLLKMLVDNAPSLHDFEGFMDGLMNLTAQTIERQELEGITRHFQNILIHGARSQPKAYDLLYQLYDWAFKSNVWGKNLPLTNIVAILSKNGRQAEAKALIEQYQSSTAHKDHWQKELLLAEGIYLFYCAKYTKCIETLEDVTHLQDERLILQAHTFKVRAAYELSAANIKDDSKEDALHKHLASFEHYLKRAHRIPKNTIKMYQGFTDALREMILRQATTSPKSFWDDLLRKKQPAMLDWLLPHIGRLSEK